VTRRRYPAVAVLALFGPVVAACSAHPASPVSAAATISGRCVAGVLDVTLNRFTSMASLRKGAGGGSASDQLAEAYRVTLTNTSTSATAAVTGFAVVFHNYAGQQTGSNGQTFRAAFIPPGRSVTWTEDPWGRYAAAAASAGPFAAGGTGAVDSGATCRILRVV
jgi:hypothetical protein